MVSESRTISLLPLAVWAEVARLGSVTRAALNLGLSKSVVSKHLTALEARLGVRLLERTSRRVQVTPEGQALLPRVETLLAESDLLFEEARQRRSAPGGLVRVAATPELGGYLAEHLLPQVFAQYPEVRIAMTADYRLEDLQDPSFDFAFRVGSVEDETLVARSLGGFCRVLVARPGFAPHLEHPDQLAEVPCLPFSRQETRSRWTLEGPEGEVCTVAVRGPLAVASFTTLMRLAQAGRGVALVPDLLAGPALTRGDLVRVLPAWRSSPSPVYLVHRVGADRIQRVRVVLDLVRAHAPALLSQAASPAYQNR